MSSLRLLLLASLQTTIALLLTMIWCTPSYAQQAAPNAEQVSLYQRAQVAYEEGDYEATIALLETANAIQPFDLFTYNIARAHFRLRNCHQARENYKKARLLPALGPNLITQIRDGLDELENVCTGTIEVTCSTPNQTTLSIDGNEATLCKDFVATELKPGAHTLTASLDEQQTTLPFEITGMESTTLSVELRPIPKPLPFASTLWGRRLTITGGALLGGALLLDQTLVRFRNDDYIAANQASLQTTEVLARRQRLRRSQAFVLGMGTLGLIATSVGVPLWVRGVISDERIELGLAMNF